MRYSLTKTQTDLLIGISNDSIIQTKLKERRILAARELKKDVVLISMKKKLKKYWMNLQMPL